VFLAAAGRFLSGATGSSFFDRPDTLLGWRRRLLRKRRTYAERPRGRAKCSSPDESSSYQRVVSELAGIDQRASATTVAETVRQADISLADARTGLSWWEFLRTHAASKVPCNFFIVETLWLGRSYVLFFIEPRARHVHLAGCAPISGDDSLSVCCTSTSTITTLSDHIAPST